MALGTQVVDLTGFAPETWDWANRTTGGDPAQVEIETAGLVTVSLVLGEDGLRLDRLLLTTDTTFTPVAYGPAGEFCQPSDALYNERRTARNGPDDPPCGRRQAHKR